MGYVYKRGRKLWIGYTGPDGRLKQMSTGFAVGQEAKARKLLKRIEDKVAAGVGFGEAQLGPATVKRYAAHWLEGRVADAIVSATDDEARLRLHVLPYIGKLKMADVRTRHVRDLVKTLKRNGKLAPRSVRHVYGVLHTMFKDAVVDDLIDANPCVLKRGDLPKKVDKDPTWRANAVFTRDELELMISDHRTAEDRRVVYALMGVAGLRFGEASGLRWRHYDAMVEPLGRLLVAVSYNTRKRQEKAVKTEQPRQVPVHPVLKKILATWKLEGWHAMMGRHPQPDDLIIPSRRGKNRSRHHSLNKLHKDLDRLGLRRRRQHDLRRTFITLARIDGARKDVLEVITHAPRGDILDQYTSLPWPLLCEAVSALQLELREARVIELRSAVNAGATRPEPNAEPNDDGPDDGDTEAGAAPVTISLTAGLAEDRTL